MKYTALFIFVATLILPIGCAGRNESGEGKAALPTDVTRFKERRDLCDHFRGEEPYDEERRIFLEENLKKYCTGTDEDLAALRKKYAGNATVTELLSQYEDRIESPD